MGNKRKIAFTLCSNNYLAQAKVLGDSLLQNNPDYHFVIGLVDELNQEIDYSAFSNFEIILIKDIEIPDFDELWKKYDIVEFNTSVKASFVKFLLNRYSETLFVIYFDPDIQIFESLKDLESRFQTHEILLTPHIITPIPLDELTPGENTFLNYGIYNLGFIAVKNHSKDVSSFLDWWEERTLSRGYSDVQNGFFVDQLWINLIPLYFPQSVKILYEMGYNAGPWNLHERKDLKFSDDNEGVMPDGSKLYFYHFSNYKVDSPEEIATYYNRVPMYYSDSLKSLYEQYHRRMLNANASYLSKLESSYTKEKRQIEAAKDRKSNVHSLKANIKNLIPPIFLILRRKLRDLYQ